MKNGTCTRYAGLVNLVVWERVYKQHRTKVKSQSFIGVTGKLQVQSGVTHLVAEALWIPEIRLTTEETKSSDFH